MNDYYNCLQVKPWDTSTDWMKQICCQGHEQRGEWLCCWRQQCVLCWPQQWVGCVAVDHIHCCWLLADRLAAKNVVSKMTCLVLSEMLKLNSANQFEMLCEGVWHLCLAAYTQPQHACSNALSLVCCCLALIRRCVWLVHCCLALIRLCGWRWWVRQFSWSLSAVPLPWWSPLKTAN